MTMIRRTFLAELTAGLAAAACAPRRAAAAGRPPRILLRSSWQTVNIGDIAHTPGALALLEKHIPDAEVRLWPSKVDNGVAELLKKRFPKVAIVQGADAIKAAIAGLLRDPARMRDLGLKGRACVQNDFHRDKLMEELANTLDERFTGTAVVR